MIRYLKNLNIQRAVIFLWAELGDRGEEMAMNIAERLFEIPIDWVPFIFKDHRKAKPLSIDSFTGIGARRRLKFYKK